MDISELSKSELDKIIDEYIINMQNADRNRKLMKRRLFDGVTYQMLAEEFNLSIIATQKIYAKCMKIIIKHIN